MRTKLWTSAEVVKPDVLSGPRPAPREDEVPYVPRFLRGLSGFDHVTLNSALGLGDSVPSLNSGLSGLLRLYFLDFKRTLISGFFVQLSSSDYRSCVMSVILTTVCWLTRGFQDSDFQPQPQLQLFFISSSTKSPGTLWLTPPRIQQHI